MALSEWYLVDYGRRQREYRRISRYPIHTVEVAGVTLEEAIKRAQALYPARTVTPTAARKWVGRNMLPSPEIESFGRGRGTRAHYPADTPAQMATAAYLMELRYTQGEIAQARRVVLEGVPLEGLMVDVVALLETGKVPGKPMRIPPAEAAAIAEAVQRYAMTLATARSGQDVTRPLPTCLHKKKWTEDDKPMFSCFASALGYYIDPRGEPDIAGVAGDLDRQIRELKN